MVELAVGAFVGILIGVLVLGAIGGFVGATAGYPGLFYFYANYTPSGTRWCLSSRLSYTG